VSSYVDSNLLTRFYLQTEDLPLPGKFLLRVREGTERLPVFWLHQFEVSNAFLLHVFAARSGVSVRISPETAAVCRTRFLDEFQSNEGLLFRTHVPDDELWRQFEGLSLRHTPARGYRTYDLLHVAAALLLGCDTFWSFDAKANDLAKREGLMVA
jgi:predicted nucleic acid-binding protein